jgi:hypothetical protein
MSTMWSERRAGESAPFGQTQVDLVKEENAVLISDGVPDWIKDPITHRQVRVEGVELQKNVPCPNCKHPIDSARVLVAQRDGHPEQQLVVYECPRERTFVFASRARSRKEPPTS